MAGSSGADAPAATPFAVPGTAEADGPPSYAQLTATMNTMVDSITTLQNQMTALLPQMALLTEDPAAYLKRTGPNAVPGDPGGPAVRERVWAYA